MSNSPFGVLLLPFYWLQRTSGYGKFAACGTITFTPVIKRGEPHHDNVLFLILHGTLSLATTTFDRFGLSLTLHASGIVLLEIIL